MNLKEIQLTVTSVESTIIEFGYTKPLIVEVTAISNEFKFSFTTDMCKAPRVGDVLKMTIEQVDE